MVNHDQVDAYIRSAMRDSEVQEKFFPGLGVMDVKHVLENQGYTVTRKPEVSWVDYSVLWNDIRAAGLKITWPSRCTEHVIFAFRNNGFEVYEAEQVDSDLTPADISYSNPSYRAGVESGLSIADMLCNSIRSFASSDKERTALGNLSEAIQHVVKALKDTVKE